MENEMTNNEANNCSGKDISLADVVERLDKLEASNRAIIQSLFSFNTSDSF